MRTINTALLLFAVALAAHRAPAQGTVLFNNRVPGIVITHVYLPSPASPSLVQIGNGPSDLPAGTTDWTGWVPVAGSGFSAQLFAAPGADIPVDSLVPAFPITSFRTGAAAGFLAGTTATLTAVAADAPVATIQVRVWDNQGGTITTWGMAVARPPGTEILGVFPPINLFEIGGFQTPPALLGLQSFNLIYNIPEPSMLGLCGLAALSFGFAGLMKRR
jgi:hypothetical protein